MRGLSKTCLALALTFALSGTAVFAAAPEPSLLIAGNWRVESSTAIKSMRGFVGESPAIENMAYVTRIVSADHITRISQLSFGADGRVRIELSDSSVVDGFYLARQIEPLSIQDWTDTVIRIELGRGVDDKEFIAMNLTQLELWYRAGSFDRTAYGVEIVSTIERGSVPAPSPPRAQPDQPTRPSLP